MLTEAFNEYRYASFNDEGTYANAIEPHSRLITAFRKQSEEEAVAAHALPYAPRYRGC